MWTASYHTWAENRLTGPEYPPVHPTPSPRPAPCFWLRGDFEQACSLEQGGDILGQSLENSVESETQKRKQLYRLVVHLSPSHAWIAPPFPSRGSSARSLLKPVLLSLEGSDSESTSFFHPSSASFHLPCLNPSSGPRPLLPMTASKCLRKGKKAPHPAPASGLLSREG